MVQLIDSDIRTREVVGWQGVHVLHYTGSSCSQKLRIFLNLKGIAWESHPVDLPANENFTPWFLGINPRGLVPVLVHDGAVHIESNDIITHLEKTFPSPRLIPAGHENEVTALLRHEDDLHLDLRTLSFRFVFDRPGPPKSAEMLARYAENGSGTVQGAQDREKAVRLPVIRSRGCIRASAPGSASSRRVRNSPKRWPCRWRRRRAWRLRVTRKLSPAGRWSKLRASEARTSDSAHHFSNVVLPTSEVPRGTDDGGTRCPIAHAHTRITGEGRLRP